MPSTHPQVYSPSVSLMSSTPSEFMMALNTLQYWRLALCLVVIVCEYGSRMEIMRGWL